MIEHVVFMLEEPSAQDFLEGLLPILGLGHLTFHYLVFEGKQDLEKRLVQRMRGWLRPNTRFIVMRDQDSGDCQVIKARLRELCQAAGRDDALIRIACRELESFFVGDWQAIAEAFDAPALAAHGRKAKFRNPDALGCPSAEIKRLIPGYQKRDGARRISGKLMPERNRSASFKVLFASLQQLAAA